MLTNAKAVKAPKLMKLVDGADAEARAMSPTAPVSTRLMTGVWNRGET